MSPTPRTLAVLLAAGAVLSGCGDSTSPTEVQEPVMLGARSVKATPSFSTDIQDIIRRASCGDGGCHGTGQGSLWLGTDVQANYRALVNRRAVTESQFLLVEPFDAENSYVVMRFENRQDPVLPRMPVGPPLDSIDLQNWRNWIDIGAPSN